MIHPSKARWPFHGKLVAAAGAFAIIALSLAVAQDPPAGPEEDPFGKKGEAVPKDPLETKAALDRIRVGELLKSDPLVLRHLRESNPTTPEQLVRAAEITLNFGAVAESKAYLKKFLADKPEDSVLAGLAPRMGSDLFLRLGSEKEIQPEGRQVAKLVLTAADKVVKDPARITRLIGEISHADPAMRETAANDLVQAGTSAVVPLIAALGDPSRAKEFPAIAGSLIRLKVVSEGPLLAALDSPDEFQRIAVIQILGYLGSNKAVPYLVRPAVDPESSDRLRGAARHALLRLVNASPTAAESERYLRRRLKALLATADVLSQDLSDVVEVWKWDAGQKVPAPLILPRSDATLLLAARLAEDLYALAPKIENQRLHVMTRLELDKILAGLDKPLPRDPAGAFALASSAGEDAMSELLEEAVKQNRIAAAIAACEVLGEIGHARLLEKAGGQESPLARVLLHPDHRLRISAALAIMRLNPSVSFPGASRLTDTLAYYAATTGTRRVLVGHPRADDGQTLVGFMNELGYEAEAAYTGKGVMRLAIASPDYDFFLISDAMDSPQITELVQSLRKDFRTARLPIGVMAHGERLEKMKEAFAGDELTTVFPRIHDGETAAFEVSRLVALAGRNLMTTDERVDQAAAALDALAFLAEKTGPQPVYDLVRHEGAVIRALTAPGLSGEAAQVLGRLATPKCQTALVDFISQHARPIDDRKAAAAALADAVAHRGILLTKAQILEQYDRYNASATLDKETQDLLSQVLDTLESKKEKKKSSPLP